MGTVANRAGGRTRKKGRSYAWAELRRPTTVIVLSLAIAMAIGVVVGEGALVRALGLRLTSNYGAFLLGVTTTFVVLLVVGFTLAESGAVSWLTGGEAEKWTAAMLAKVHPREVFHNLVFAVEVGDDRIEFDIDNVAVGTFGALVVETKFSSQPLDLSSERWPSKVRRDAEQLLRNTKRVRSVLAAAAPELPIHSLLVYWGGKVIGPPGGVRQLGTVQVARGRQGLKRLPDILRGDVARSLQEAATAALRNYEDRTRHLS